MWRKGKKFPFFKFYQKKEIQTKRDHTKVLFFPTLLWVFTERVHQRTSLIREREKREREREKRGEEKEGKKRKGGRDECGKKTKNKVSWNIFLLISLFSLSLSLPISLISLTFTAMRTAIMAPFSFNLALNLQGEKKNPQSNKNNLLIKRQR
jgi:hypothetical protein